MDLSVQEEAHFVSRTDVCWAWAFKSFMGSSEILKINTKPKRKLVHTGRHRSNVFMHFSLVMSPPPVFLLETGFTVRVSTVINIKADTQKMD